MKNVNPNKVTIDAMNETMSEEITVDELFAGIETPEESEAFNSIQSASGAFDGDCIEWKNGDECVFDNKTGRYFSDYTLEYLHQRATIHCQFKNKQECDMALIEFSDGYCCAVLTETISKPETEADRNERERLEAAYDLYLSCGNYLNPEKFDLIKNLTSFQVWINIVDKTGYRKERQ